MSFAGMALAMRRRLHYAALSGVKQACYRLRDCRKNVRCHEMLIAFAFAVALLAGSGRAIRRT